MSELNAVEARRLLSRLEAASRKAGRRLIWVGGALALVSVMLLASVGPGLVGFRSGVQWTQSTMSRTTSRRIIFRPAAHSECSLVNHIASCSRDKERPAPVVTLAGIVSAENVWFLWMSDFLVSGDGERRYSTPVRLGVYGSKTACDLELRKTPSKRDTRDRLRRTARDMLGDTESNFVITKKAESVEAGIFAPPDEKGSLRPLVGTVFECLPDTEEPRRTGVKRSSIHIEAWAIRVGTNSPPAQGTQATASYIEFMNAGDAA